MACTYEIADHPPMIVLVHEGPPVVEEFVAALDAAFADPRYVRGMPVLSDRRRVTGAPTGAQRLAALEYLRRHTSEMIGMRWASVVATPVAYGATRQAMVEAEEVVGLQMAVFFDIDEARAWLAGTSLLREAQ